MITLVSGTECGWVSAQHWPGPGRGRFLLRAEDTSFHWFPSWRWYI